MDLLEVSHRALRQAKSIPGDNAAIVGQGVIGLSALAYCTALGFQTAIVESEPTRLKIAKQMGATLTVSPAVEGFVERIVSFFDGDGADFVLKAASDWSAIRTAMEIARTDAAIVVVSRHTQQPDFDPLGYPFPGKRLNLVTTYGYPPDGHRWDARRSVVLTMNLLACQKVTIKPMITHRFACDELPQVYQRLDQGDQTIVGSVFRW